MLRYACMFSCVCVCVCVCLNLKKDAQGCLRPSGHVVDVSKPRIHFPNIFSSRIQCNILPITKNNEQGFKMVAVVFSKIF